VAVKTIAVGETVTSSDVNRYLANSGLVYIKSQTIGTAQSNILVSDAFSTEYENYKVILSGGVGSTAQNIAFQLDGAGANYYGSTIVANYSSTSVSSASVNNSGFWGYAGASSTDTNFLSVDIFSPYFVKTTGISGPYIDPRTTGNGGIFSGFHNVGRSFTAFRLIVAGTMTGGTITVYGYREFGTETTYNEAGITYNEAGYTYNDRGR